MDVKICRYKSEFAPRWNSFVETSPNGSFLFNRGFMDYHSDRFEDVSMMAFSEKGELIGVLPANQDGSALHSHQGLTYGGWIVAPRADASVLWRVWQEWLAKCREEGFSEIYYKPLPLIYHKYPAQADEYFLFRSGAQRVETNLSSTVNLRTNVGFNKLMRRQLRQSQKLGLEVVETTDTKEFVHLLQTCLLERHNARPVHTADELELLRSRFPHNIRIFAVRLDGKMQAGVCVFDSSQVAHAQYICSSALGRELHLLPLIFDYLINTVFLQRQWFDFGISCEDHGKILNEGLLRQKTALGGTPTIYSRYRIPLGT